MLIKEKPYMTFPQSTYPTIQSAAAVSAQQYHTAGLAAVPCLPDCHIFNSYHCCCFFLFLMCIWQSWDRFIFGGLTKEGSTCAIFVPHHTFKNIMMSLIGGKVAGNFFSKELKASKTGPVRHLWKEYGGGRKAETTLNLCPLSTYPSATL